MAEQKHFKSVVHTINFWVACLLTTLSQDLAPHRTSFILLRNSSPAIQVTSFLGPSVNAYRATRIQETSLMLWISQLEVCSLTRWLENTLRGNLQNLGLHSMTHQALKQHFFLLSTWRRLPSSLGTAWQAMGKRSVSWTLISLAVHLRASNFTA